VVKWRRIDGNSIGFIHALMKKEPPPDKVGISYMLAGDEGASNTDPYATGKTADNHWVVTGPHVMVFGPPSKTLGYTESKDPDPTKPYMMWAGTRDDPSWNQTIISDRGVASAVR
jgi:hypothetical protein